MVTFGRQTTAVDPAMRLVLSRKSSPSACSRPVGNEAAERLFLRDDICWRLRLDAPQQGWLSTLLPKVTPLLVSVLTSLGAAFWIVRYFMGPLGKLRDGLKRPCPRRFQPPHLPDPKQRDELAMLGRDFDQTAARLQEFQQGPGTAVPRRFPRAPVAAVASAGGHWRAQEKPGAP